MLYKKVRRISAEVMELFKIYNWPGNVRELEHVIEGATNIMGTDDIIQVKHLQTHLSNWSVKTRPGKPNRRQGDVPSESHKTNLIKTTSEHEESIVTKALVDNRGNITKTARSLGISRQLLYYKIKKYKINRDSTNQV